jgi:hypothetical protein
MTFLKLLKYIFKLKSAILRLNPDPATQIIASPCGSGSGTHIHWFYANSLCRKDQGAQVCTEPGVRCFPGPVQLEILRPKPGKRPTFVNELSLHLKVKCEWTN